VHAFVHETRRDTLRRRDAEGLGRLRAAGLPRPARRPETVRDGGDARRRAHNPATTGSVSARQYAARTQAQPRRNRPSKTGQRRITRGMCRGCARASCTDSTGHRTAGTRGAGIIRRSGPRTGPRPRPCVPGILLLCVNVADDMDQRPQADRVPGPTVDLYAATHTVRLADAGSAR
jgi:hypothetical protein